MDASNQDVAAGDNFPVKLMKLIHAAEVGGKTDVISWLGDGTKFKVHDKNRFSADIMPHYFASSSYKSFQRSKNLWGFQTVSKGVHKGECSHPLFVRGDITSCRKMVRGAKNDDEGDKESSDQVSAGANSSITSKVGTGVGQQHGLASVQQTFLDSLSGFNPSLLLAQNQQQQQRQQLQLHAASLASNTHLGATNPFLSAFASLGDNSSNANLLSALRQNMQAPPPNPGYSMASLQQILQLAPQLPQNQSLFNQQVMALLSLQQQQSATTGTQDLSILSSTAAAAAATAPSKGRPVTTAAAPPPSSTTPFRAIDAISKSGNELKKKAKTIDAISTSGNKLKDESKTKGKTNKDDGNVSVKTKNRTAVLTLKTISLREAAVARGSKVVPCRARGTAMDHNMHVSDASPPTGI
jgi:hypothetical protein